MTTNFTIYMYDDVIPSLKHKYDVLHPPNMVNYDLTIISAGTSDVGSYKCVSAGENIVIEVAYSVKLKLNNHQAGLFSAVLIFLSVITCGLVLFCIVRTYRNRRDQSSPSYEEAELPTVNNKSDS